MNAQAPLQPPLGGAAISAPAFPTGRGQSDTRASILSDGRPNPHPSAGTAYETVTGRAIAAVVEAPETLPKEAAPWFIPSDYAEADARSHEVQRERGRFWWLAADLDEGDPSLEALRAALRAVVGDAGRMIYATRSSRPGARRWRALVPLAEPIAGADYADTATAFLDLLAEAGGGELVPDRALTRPAQLVYLPNRGEHYEHEVHKAPRLRLTADHAVIRRRDKTRAARAAAEREARERAERRWAERLTGGAEDGPSPVDAFNARHRVAELLERYGYKRCGGSADWRSPMQTSKSFATRDLGEAWVSLSASDVAAGIGGTSRNGAAYGDAFDLFVHFEHGGDFEAAVRAYGGELRDRGEAGSRVESYAAASRWEHEGSAPAARAIHASGSPRRASQFFAASAWAGRPVPEREWLVHGLVPSRNVTLLSGDGGTGKSQVALQLAIAVVAQRPWLGRPVVQGRAIYLSAEDDEDELHRRTDAILRAEGLDFANLDRLTVRSLAGEDALLATETAVALTETALMGELHATAEADPPALIVLDTLADLYPANENDRAKVRAFIGLLRHLSLRHRCAVVLLGHPSLSGMSSGAGTSGSTAWSNSVRSRLYLERVVQDGFEADPDARVITTKKANYGRTGAQIAVRWDRGVFVAKDAAPGLDAKAASAKAKHVFLKLLDQFTAEGRNVSHATGQAYAPKRFAEHPDVDGVTSRALRAAMDELLRDGVIVVAEHGPDSRRRKHLERAGAARA